MKYKGIVSVLALATAWGTFVDTAAAQTAARASPALAPVESPAAAARPNVLVWMIDDVGFGQLSSFGGLVETPNIDRVARLGLRYTNFHTAPICSASRAAFLTGRNPHAVHIGGHAAAARNFPGYDARIPASAATIAENLRQAGYATFALGKWDHLPSEEASPTGPFKYWPSGQGFERFYGFLAADTDNWTPTLIRDTTPVGAPTNPGYHLSADLADEAISMIESRHASREPRPFFMYWATGAAHAPHHAPQSWMAHYQGRFDMGWDEARRQILDAQKRVGLVPMDTVLAPLPEGMPAWAGLTDDERRLFAREMEAFAASLSYADVQFGRILDALEASGELDNTIVVITSDNGASAEGGPTGLHNEAIVTGSSPPTPAQNLAFYNRWGGPETYPHYAYGWAVAGNTPFRYYKQVAHEGGTRVPLVVAWPQGVPARGELRDQFAYVTDIAPTILDMVDVQPAEVVHNVRQSPMEGATVALTMANAQAPGHTEPQYVELYGNRGLWWDGWYLAATHRTQTWDWRTSSSFDEPWELYDLRRDPGQTSNLAAENPQRVAQMSAMFEEQARRYNVNPMHNLSDTRGESMQRAARDFSARGGQWRFGGPVSNIPQALAPPVNTRNFTMTAEIDLPSSRVTGPLFAYGGQLGGMGLYLNDGRPTFIVNQLDGQETIVAATGRVRSGRSRIQFELERLTVPENSQTRYRIEVLVNGEQFSSHTMDLDIPWYFGIAETFGVGQDQGSPVLDGYAPGVPFPGAMRNVVFRFQDRAGGHEGR